jgi:nucleoside-diphosphate-sugar epimerase
MVFVTGATGLVGARILYDLLISGKKVRALKRASSDLDFLKQVLDFHHGADSRSLMDGIDWHEGDILDSECIKKCLQGCDEVYHAAAKVSFHSADRDLMYQVNIRGTANIVDMSIEAGVKRLCHISSVASLGRAVAGDMVTEESGWVDSDDTSHYAVTKFRAEMEVWRGAQEGLDATIINPVLVIGPTDPKDSSGQLFLTASKGMGYYADGTSALVDVKDVSQMALALMNQGGPTERFILCAETLTSKSFFGKMAKAFGKPAPTKPVSKGLVNVAWRVLWLKDKIFGTRSTLTKETAHSVFTKYAYDGSKASSRAQMKYITVEESVQAYVPFYSDLNLV